MGISRCVLHRNHLLYDPRYLIIPIIGVHKVYYETHALLSSTKLRIYDKYKRDRVKVILFYKSEMESNKFLFNTTVPKIGHKLFRAGYSCVYICTK